jgi:hypothetical protein
MIGSDAFWLPLELWQTVACSGSAMMRPCPVRLCQCAAARPQFWPLVLRRCRSPAEATADAAP